MYKFCKENKIPKCHNCTDVQQMEKVISEAYIKAGFPESTIKIVNGKPESFSTQLHKNTCGCEMSVSMLQFFKDSLAK